MTNRRSQPGYSDLLAEHEACVTEEECWEAEEEPSYPEDTYDSYSDCDDYRREATDEERW